MVKKKEIFIALISAALITSLFHRQALGLNLLIYTILLVSYLKITNQIKFKTVNHIVCTVGLMTTALFTVLTHSLFSYVMYFISLLIFIGLLIYPDVKSLAYSTALSLVNTVYSQMTFLHKLREMDLKSKKKYIRLKKTIIFIVPLLIILLFIALYRASNIYFDSIVDSTINYFQDNILSVFKDFDALIILTFIIGLVISNFILFRTPNQPIIDIDIESKSELKRVKSSPLRRLKFNVLKDEYKAGIFLFGILNLILLVLNIIDIYWVWFNFEWQGQNLKQFVHEGTYILILSILISLSLVLFFFRKNLNFYPGNKLLKYLSYSWLVQNGILAISVGIRNFWYINYYSLAYRRIGVIIFLVMTIYGLYTVYVKVKYKKSAFYLVKNNFLSIFTILIVSSVINWDSLIADYNFSHSDKSFLHLDFMAELSDQTLPALDKSLATLAKIDKIQKHNFHLATRYMTPEEYCKVISDRKITFKRNWESKNLLEWNLPEYLAYKSLF